MSCHELLFRIWAGEGVWNGSTSSSPVDIIPTLGLMATKGWEQPTDASTAMCSGRIRVPADKTWVPSFTSSAWKQMLW